MGEYQRVTTACSVNEIRPEISQAIQAHIEKYELEGILDTVLICCETVSTKEKKKLFGKKVEVEINVVVLTPKWLISAGGKENEKASVFSARLQNLRVEDYEGSKMYQMIADTGLNVFGFETLHGPGSVFIGLGSEPAAGKFRNMLKEGLAQV